MRIEWCAVNSSFGEVKRWSRVAISGGHSEFSPIRFPQWVSADVPSHDPAIGALRCEIRCHLRADVDEHIRWSPDVASSGMSGFYGRPRTMVALGVEVGVGSSSEGK